MSIKSLFRDEINQLKPIKFTYGFDADPIRLNIMENPYDTPLDLKQRVNNNLKLLELNRYPSTNYDDTITLLKQALNIPNDLDVMLANGATELILLLAVAFKSVNNTIMYSTPSYYFYKRAALFANKTVIEIPIKENFQLNLNEWLEKIESLQPELIFITNPNNPTAVNFNYEDLCKIIEKASGVVVIDEVYYPYSAVSFIDLIARHPHLVVLRSLSKIGLAALRLGFLIGNKEIIHYMRQLTIPFAISSFTLVALKQLLPQFDYIQQQVTLIIKNRDMLIAELKRLPLINVFPSDSNYVVIKLSVPRCQELYQYLCEHHIYVQLLDGIHPVLKDCIRFSVGTEPENQQLTHVIDQFLRRINA